MPIPVAAYNVIPLHEIRYGNQPRIIPASRLVAERGFRNRTVIEWSLLFHLRLTGVGIEMVAGLGLSNAVIEDMRRW